MATHDIKELGANLPRLAAALHKRIGDVMAEVTLTLYREIILRNAVDTGYSRANWNISVGDIDPTVTAPPPESDRGLHKGNIKAKPAPNLNIDGSKPVYITNSVHYVKYLEYGTEKMAPRPMVRPAIARTRARINNIVKAFDKNLLP
jgi:HK97 gp10 family phage protein